MAENNSTKRPNSTSTRLYKQRYSKAHPRSQRDVMLEHILVAENALGHYLPPKAVVHHVDGNGFNNANRNLVICENQRYHLLLHTRQRVINLGGDPNTDKICGTCHTLKPLSEFSSNRAQVDGLVGQCKPCNRAYQRDKYVYHPLKR